MMLYIVWAQQQTLLWAGGRGCDRVGLTEEVTCDPGLETWEACTREGESAIHPWQRGQHVQT